ncbi:hypothetical protein V6N13_081359 [Hibiscus sabdariffa]
MSLVFLQMGTMPNGINVLIKEAEAHTGFPVALLAVKKPCPENKDAGDTEDDDDDDEKDEAAGDEDEDASEDESGKDGEGEDGGDPEDEPEADRDGASGNEDEDDDDDDDDGKDKEEEETYTNASFFSPLLLCMTFSPGGFINVPQYSLGLSSTMFRHSPLRY